jgi:hypothetical protein
MKNLGLPIKSKWHSRQKAVIGINFLDTLTLLRPPRRSITIGRKWIESKLNSDLIMSVVRFSGPIKLWTAQMKAKIYVSMPPMETPVLFNFYLV